MMLQWDPIRTLLWHQFCWNSATGLVDEILIVSPGLDICLYLWCVFICLIGGLKPYVGWWSPMANIYFSVGWSQQPVYWIVADTSHSFSWWKPQGHTLRASFSRFEVCQQGHCLIISYHHFLHRKYIAATWDIPWHDIPWYIYIYYLILGNPIPQLVSQFLPILIIDGPEILNFRVHPLLHTRSRFVFAHKSSTPKSQTVSFSPCVKIITSPNLRLNYSSFSAIWW